MKKEEFKQPEINIGLVGHVDHGKTTLTEQLTGNWTDTHSEELKRGITIRLGYANTTFRICTKCKTYTVKETCVCGGKTKITRTISFVDAPGHESLMATMLSGATIMDAALLIIAANEKCPQPQTREHLMALEISGIENIIIIQNKIDLISEEAAIKNYEQIKSFVSDTKFKDAPIIPISALHGANIDILIKTIEENFLTPKRDIKKDPIMLIARSFDINKPGMSPSDIIGGVLGGAIIQGTLKKGQKIEIRPGRKVEKENQIHWEPLYSTIVSINSGKNKLDSAKPGGSVAVLTLLDPSIVKSDKLVGSLVSLEGKLPPVWQKLNLEIHLLKRVVGSKEDLKVEPIKISELLMLNVNSASTVGIVNKLGKNNIECSLKLPICAKKGSRITISRRVGNRFRLIGYGIID